MYVDADFESLLPIDPLLGGGGSCFLGSLDSGRVSNAIIGAVPRHPLLARAIAELRPRTTFGPVDREGTGPLLIERIRSDFPDVTVFEPNVFYATEREQARYAFHLSARSWKDEAGLRSDLGPRRAGSRDRPRGSAQAPEALRPAAEGRLAEQDLRPPAGTVTAVQIAGESSARTSSSSPRSATTTTAASRQAERLIEAAAEAGADAVKFQTHIAEAEMLPVDADAAALRRAAVRVHEADGAVAGRPPSG